MKPTDPEAKAGGRPTQLPPVPVLHDLLITLWACGVTTDGRVDPAQLLVTSSVKSSLIPPDRLSFSIICSHSLVFSSLLQTAQDTAAVPL